MPDKATMTLGGEPLDPDNLTETLGCLETMNAEDIPFGPRLVKTVMGDAALIIRALAEKAGVELEPKK